MVLKHPINGHEAVVEAIEWLPGCAYFQCPKTKLQWLDPQPPGGPVFPDFSSYSDTLLANASTEKIYKSTPPNEQAALEWVAAEIRPQAKVVELFAEAGRFAWILRSKGYQVFVSDPLESHVSVLLRHGFNAERAVMPDELPGGWADADAVIILESIVRVSRPGEFMESVRRRFPRAKIYMTAPSMRRPLKLEGVSQRVGYPPDFLTRWTTAALHELVEHAGYDALSRRITPRLLTAFGRARWRGKINLIIMSVLMWLSGEYEYSVAAWGEVKKEL